MENNENFEVLDTLEDGFNFKKLPRPAQKAYFADANPLWKRNKDGKRVRPKRKRRKVSSRTAKRRKSIAELTKKPKTTKSTTKRRKKSGGLSVGQKLTIAAVGIGIVTIAIVKRPTS